MSRYSSARSPKVLHEELAINPDFFVMVLQWLYLPNKEELIEEEIIDIDNDVLLFRTKQAYKLLSSWNKIPGTNEFNVINNEVLNTWVAQVRNKSKDVGRLDAADTQIGQILAQYPESEDPWPPESICYLIDSINSKKLNIGFSMGVKKYSCGGVS